jgi:hypothetical protein
LRSPTESRQTGYIDEFPRRPVGPARVKDNLAIIAHRLRDEASEFGDAHIFADADVEMLIAVVVLQNEYGGVGEIFDV